MRKIFGLRVPCLHCLSEEAPFSPYRGRQEEQGIREAHSSECPYILARREPVSKSEERELRLLARMRAFEDSPEDFFGERFEACSFCSFPLPLEGECLSDHAPSCELAFEGARKGAL